MAPEPMVLEDGVEQETTRPRGTPPWLLVVVAFGFGLALGTLVSPSDDDSGSGEAPSTPTTEQPPVTLPALEEGAGIGAHMAGFPSGIAAVGSIPNDGGLHHLVWPLDGPLLASGMTNGDDVRLDATGQFVALSQPVPGTPGVVLSSGRPTSVQPVLSGVTGYEWHDSRSGELAFTTSEDGGWSLFRASRTLVPELVAEGEDEGATVVGWGDWGYAVQITEGQVALLNAEGDFRDVERGRGLDSHHSGWLVMVDEDLKLVSAGGGVRRVLPLNEELQPVAAASFSPDATKVALAGSFGIAVIDVDRAEVTDLSPAFPAGWVSWSSDSRFVIAPAFSGVMIHDLESGDSSNVLREYSIHDAAALPEAAS